MKHFSKPFLLAVFWVALCDAQTPVFYGTTAQGGINNGGTIIKFDPATDSENVVWDFSTDTSGRDPRCTLMYDVNNNLFYGTTAEGGDSGLGVLFSFNPVNNQENTLWKFVGGTDAGGPAGNLVPGTNGLLYGVTALGGGKGCGGHGCGTIYSFDPVANKEKVVWSFGGADAENPRGSLFYNTSDGFFYGTAPLGGKNNAGTIFKFDPVNDTAQLIWSFGSGTDGRSPWENFTPGPNGILYTTTTGGGTYSEGAIISYDPISANEKVVWSFYADTLDGRNAQGGLVYNAGTGLFYGMTEFGGTYDDGIIFSFNPVNDSEKVLWVLEGGPDDGLNPWGSLTYDVSNGLFYGMTWGGGSDYDGAIISFNPVTDSVKLEWSLGAGFDGIQPYASFATSSTYTSIAPTNKQQAAIDIYPNPAQADITINLPPDRAITVQCINLLGQMEMQTALANSSTPVKLNISDLVSGIYFLKVVDEKNNLIGLGKFVKE